MELKIYWTDFAKSQLKEVYFYYRENATLNVATRLVEKLIKETRKLQTQPEIGQKEILLEDRKEGFRYLVCKNYKIIYWFNGNKNRIEITDIFDTRQNPIKMKRE